MKEKKIHEGCIEQIHRMFVDRLYKNGSIPVDDKGRVRIDDWELRDDVQGEVAEFWGKVTSDNLESLTDIKGYRTEFLKLFGFGIEGIDYESDVDPDIKIPSIV